MKEDLLRVMDKFYDNGKLAHGCNSSFIILIPKKDGICGLQNLRPISLIGSLYKIIAIVLANKLKQVVGKLNGESQSAFIKGHNILDSVVVLNEIIDEARRSKERQLIFKIDFAKAYDSVDWRYLFDMLQLMNFPTKWVGWMREWVTTASANVLVNGVPLESFLWNEGFVREILYRLSSSYWLLKDSICW